MALAIGTPAPNIVLKGMIDGELKEVNLADHKGKDNVVLLFFPGAFTGVCTTEFCDVSSGLAGLPTDGAAVYGISGDTAFAQAAWAKANNITVKLLADYTHKTIEAYDVVLPDLAGMGPSSLRAAYIIDKEGVIRYVQVTPTPGDLPDFGAINEALASL
ncbi:MAG: redoxin domain-containing protein [Armatimonadetes bacterium]|nr:redoxin domain-containing protein [Armatimonadota bacterium]